MTDTDGIERVEIASIEELRRWLAANHAQRESIWLVTFKKHVADKYVPRDAVVEEALCFGWIDSLPRKLDDDRTMLRLSPRQSGSAWSKVNRDKIARLEKEKRLHPAGIAKIQAAKADGSWDFLNDVETLAVPDDLAAALAAYPHAAARFAAFPPSSRRGILEWIKLAKRPETRAKRVAETARLAEDGLRANFPESKR